MRPANVLRLYRVRLRARAMQECLAIAGIATGVALLFASQVASRSLQSSAAQLSRYNSSLRFCTRSKGGTRDGYDEKWRRESLQGSSHCETAGT